jgi:Permeases of the drug/metabolite transporter (DMT) superfamily
MKLDRQIGRGREEGRLSPGISLALGFCLAGSSVLPGKVLSGLPIFFAAAAGAGIALLPLLPLAGTELRRSGLRRKEQRTPSGDRAPTLHSELASALPLLFVQALFGMALYRVLILAALSRTSAAEVGMASSATPAFTLVLAALFLEEHISLKDCAGIIVVGIGIAAIESDKASPIAGFTVDRVSGLLLALGAAASEAIFNVAARRLPSRLGPMVSSAAVTAIAFVLLVGLSMATGERIDPAALEPKVVGALAYQGLGVSALAYILFYRGAARLPASTIGAFSGFIPLAGLVAAVIFLGERPGIAGLLGACLALIGMALCPRGEIGQGNDGGNN